MSDVKTFKGTIKGTESSGKPKYSIRQTSKHHDMIKTGTSLSQIRQEDDSSNEYLYEGQNDLQ